MSSSIATATLVVKGIGHPICYSTHAIYHLETEAGKPYGFFLQRLALGSSGARELLHVLWAGLEGARVTSGVQRTPWTLAEVITLVDDGGGLENFFDPEGEQLTKIRDVFVAAFPVTKREADKMRAEAEKQRPTSATDGSTGNDSLPAPVASASARPSSGGSPSGRLTVTRRSGSVKSGSVRPT
jgi:hypothetical protein